MTKELEEIKNLLGKVATKRDISSLQVIFDEKTKNREIDGLIEAMDTYNLKEGLIITENEQNTLEINGFKIKIIPQSCLFSKCFSIPTIIYISIREFRYKILKL